LSPAVSSLDSPTAETVMPFMVSGNDATPRGGPCPNGHPAITLDG
jgi:hypothetical protein